MSGGRYEPGWEINMTAQMVAARIVAPHTKLAPRAS